jgi:PadR family transcriptional regulator, regulatory protein PadR
MTRPALDLVHGTVDLIVLRTLAWDRMHGYGIAQFVRQHTDGAIILESAALYQALRRLEKRKLIRGWWGTTDTGRRARFYELTAAGTAALQAQSRDLRDYVTALYRVLDVK